MVGPDDTIVPDLDERLPGRGVWLSADAAVIAEAVKRKAFQRACRKPVQVPDDLAGVLQAGLKKRLVDGIGLARRAGQAVAGFEKVKAKIDVADVGVLFQASDGADDGFRKLGSAARNLGDQGRLVTVLTASDLGVAFDRDRTVHLGVTRGKLADRLVRDGMRLKGVTAETS